MMASMWPTQDDRYRWSIICGEQLYAMNDLWLDNEISDDD